MSVLVDTSVWIDHFRSGNAALANLVGSDLALTHPMVIVELACGTPPSPREQTLNSLSLLRSCNQAKLDEVLELIEREKLHGLGCGLVDLRYSRRPSSPPAHGCGPSTGACWKWRNDSTSHMASPESPVMANEVLETASLAECIAGWICFWRSTLAAP